MTRFILSKAAAADLEDIDEFTRRKFGLGQARKLRGRFRRTFDLLVAVPDGSPGRPEYDPPGKEFRYCAAVTSFVIVYEPSDDGIRVVRVLHGARDLARALERHSESL